MAQRGRPSTYNANLHPKLIKSLAAQGFTDEQIAEEFGISRAGLNIWYKKYPDLLDIRKKQIPTANDQVKQSIFQRAVGGVEKITIKEEFDAEGKLIGKTKTTEILPPDTTAQIWYSKNKMPDEFRDSRPADLPPASSNPLKVEFSGNKDLLDPSKQDNLEIGEGNG